MPLIIFFIIVVVVNLILYKKINSYTNVLVLSFLISVLSTIIFQLLAFVSMEYLDPFIIIAVTIQLFSAFLVGCIVNLIVLKIKGKATSSTP